jgi:transcriptional regulator with GAF, ATPase, and Fis domain
MITRTRRHPRAHVYIGIDRADLERVLAEEKTHAGAARRLGVSRMTVIRRRREMGV